MENMTSYFQTRMEAFGSYSNIVWTRFNWFLTIHAGLIGYLINLNQKASAPFWGINELKFLGLSLGLLWLILGYEDQNSLDRHKKRLKCIESDLLMNLINKEMIQKEGKWPIEREHSFRQTSLLILFPILTCIIWVWFLIK